MNFFKNLFNIRDNKEQAKFTGRVPTQQNSQNSAQSGNRSSVQTPQKITQQSATSNNKQIDLSALFYSLLFPNNAATGSGIANNLELSVMGQIELALSSPKDIADNVLKLPSKIVELDQKLADEAIDIKEIVTLIEQDPLLCVEVLKLCNSPAFKRAEKDIASLQQALVQIGRQQLRQFITTCLVREMIDIKPIYFRRFGSEIWRHSMQVAFICSELATREHKDSVFLLGLLHDVGKLAIFKLLIDAFHKAEPDEQPSSLLFKQVMTTKSLILSARLVKYWQLPTYVETQFNLLANSELTPTEPLALIVWKANIISECSMLREANLLADDELLTLVNKVGLTVDDFDVLHQKLINF